MAHPFKSQSDAFKGKAAARVGKAEGGAVTGYKSGGRTKGSKVNINIVVPGAGAKAGPPIMPPPMLGPAGMGPGGPPGSPMPPMKSGGRVKKASGGKLTGGTDTGVGRIQQSARLKSARGGK